MSRMRETNQVRGTAAMLLAAAWLGASALPATGAERVALVIGNADYSTLGSLRNPPNDARAIADKLSKLDFILVGGKAHVNVTRTGMLRLLNRLEDELRPLEDATALVYYSGHGVATEGENWLVPVDDEEIRFRENVPDYAIAARKGVMGRLEERGGGLNVVILDACRDNPLPTRRKTRGSLTRGLARLDTASPSNTVLVFAAAPGKVAYDGDGDFSPFTGALIAEMGTPGKRLIDVLSATGTAVKRATEQFPDGPQEPHVEMQLVERPFYFVPATDQGSPSSATQARQPLEVAFAGTAGRDLQLAAEGEAGKQPVVTDLELERELQDCPQCPRMVVIPAGTYEMGSQSGEGAHDEVHRHRVKLPEPIAIGMFEVTRGEFHHFLEETNRSGGSACWHYDGVETREGPGPTDPGFVQGDGEPMVCVSWTDAQAYVEWLSTKTRKRYRLLSESEWEYAARGGSAEPPREHQSRSGLCQRANGADQALTTHYPDWFELSAACDDGHVHTAETGSYGPNELGLHDMLGNAREWVQDCWHRDYDGAPADGSAWTDGDNCALRVLRGGSWLDGPGGVRATARDKGTTGIRFSANGFRVARALD